MSVVAEKMALVLKYFHLRKGGEKQKK